MFNSQTVNKKYISQHIPSGGKYIYPSTVLKYNETWQLDAVFL